MTALLTGLASLLVFSSVILVHELGHFMAARHCGIHVEEFSIGFGPRLWSTTRDGTTYSVRLLPLGGWPLQGKIAGIEKLRPRHKLQPLTYTGCLIRKIWRPRLWKTTITHL